MILIANNDARTYTKRPLQVLTLVFALGLSACAPVVLGGAAMTGMVAADRRTAGTQLEDERIELIATNRLNELLGERGHVNVTSFNRRVLITGEVPTAQDRQRVEAAIAQIENVRGVVNDLAVMPNASLGQRSSDSWITGQVRAGIVDARDLSSSAFKVVTERGVVYLMGIVTQREAERVTEIARGVPGVAKVVRVFEIVSEDELRRLVPPPQPTPATAAPASGG
ncbi:BON domain-containing protein [Extensimonas vulgaris]|jgi:osmotically-inducible protein OsmY|uniref:Osmotically-inducible protein OsmY n=1 Tax=Extensimonas vulgaris TaxID=1031594 RepID=A0A369AUM0_9BURK|nr:BON domain-containing protein [Extensimonas vulgaris]RCX11917.1 osmotically-inducible protein OsmY [Extensimonas vulgaris]TWI38992.1 osmotically-inducible protein OsmY [Extensimonas vulgaris]TXD14916.1 BON domain-containing protein [Extensimonas vulgaris]